MKRQNGGMASGQRTAENELRQNGRLNACKMAEITTYLPHLLYTAESVLPTTICGTHRTHSDNDGQRRTMTIFNLLYTISRSDLRLFHGQTQLRGNDMLYSITLLLIM
jgi:hypothetical protein